MEPLQGDSSCIRSCGRMVAGRGRSRNKNRGHGLSWLSQLAGLVVAANGILVFETQPVDMFPFTRKYRELFSFITKIIETKNGI